MPGPSTRNPRSAEARLAAAERFIAQVHAGMLRRVEKGKSAESGFQRGVSMLQQILMGNCPYCQIPVGNQGQCLECSYPEVKGPGTGEPAPRGRVLSIVP